MSAEGRQHVILCEGYDDRSFWSGWLRLLGCEDPTDRGSKAAADAWGLPVRGGGRFLFRTRRGSAVLLQPFDGRTKARGAVEEYVGARQAHRPRRVLLNLDGDDEDGATSTSAEDQILGIARALGATEKGGPFNISGSTLWGVVWRCDDMPSPGLPGKQTLERLVAAAICAAYPKRAAAVEAWLAAEPPGEKSGKSYGYSYLAKWYASHGAADFFECLWRDAATAAQLQTRLAASGAWRVVEDLVGD